ncbi:hypothetical protein ACE198_24645 [Neobacillus sp. KR4-4]|uniref:hypothetical protein n=1 Tax=Neobacillus sp. KR4-4 TaxID=3344872 RepID=UPI0035C9F5EA
MNKENGPWDGILNEEIEFIRSTMVDEGDCNIKKDSKNENKGTSINQGENTSKIENKTNQNNVLDAMPVGKKEHKKYYKGVYLEEDIYKVITTLVKKKGGGRQNLLSKIVNDCVRESFEKRGLV